MVLSSKLIRNFTLILIYSGAVAAAYVSDSLMIVMILTLPWSIGVTMLGMLLIHVGSYDLSTYMLGGAAINALLMIRSALTDYVSSYNPD